MNVTTPYYLIHERRLLENLKIIQKIRDVSGARSVLALKCFAAWSVFPLMRQYLDGTTSSSPYEARLGHEKFGKEVHAYSVGFSPTDIQNVSAFADKIIFNSVSQLRRLSRYCRGARIGLRVNPGISHAHFDLADPARKFSRLGVRDARELRAVLPRINGVMFHYNCENDDFASFEAMLERIGRTYRDVLRQVEWVSLGGGIYFTKAGYPVDALCQALKTFSRTFKVQVYLEPGESVITQAAELVTRVVDIVRNRADIAIVDASTEAHMLDLLIYRLNAKIAPRGPGKFRYVIAGRSCLAGDVFGTYAFASRLKIGSIVRFADAAGYTMVKKNWFNGLAMPAIAVKRLNGKIEIVREFTYNDFVHSLS